MYGSPLPSRTIEVNSPVSSFGSTRDTLHAYGGTAALATWSTGPRVTNRTRLTSMSAKVPTGIAERLVSTRRFELT